MKQILLLIIFTTLFFNCTEEEPLIIEKNSNHMIEFEESIAIRGSSTSSANSRTKEGAIELELINFNKAFELYSAYSFNGIAFNDDGKYYDKIAGDKIYTSTKLYSSDLSRERLSFGTGYNFSPNFKHSDFFASSLIKVGCKFKTVDCPDDGGFWDSDWGTGWGCVEFYDCEFEIEL